MKLPGLIFILSLALLSSFNLNAQPAFSIKRILNEANHQVVSASYSTQGNYIVTSGSDNNIIIWNARTGIIYRTLSGLRSFPAVAVFDEEKDILASAGGNDTILLWHPSTSSQYALLRGHKGKINAISVSSDGRFLASAGTDHKVIIYSLTDRKILFTLNGHETAVNDVSFSSDGTMLVSAGADGKLILWSTGSGKMTFSKEVRTAPVRCVRFSLDGKTIASGGDEGDIIITDVAGLVPVRTLSGHKGPVLSIDYSSDSKYLISGGQDQQFLLWDPQAGNIIKHSEQQEQSVVAVCFNPASHDFVTACHRSEIFCTWSINESAISALDNIINERPVEKAEKMEKDTDSKTVSKAFELEEPPVEKKVYSENIESPAPAKGKSEKKTKKIIRLDEIAVMGKSEMAEEMDAPLSAPAPLAPPDVPVIEVFSPSVTYGEATSDRSSIYIIGRVTNAEGTSVILINKKPVRLSEAGVFEFRMDLARGFNPVDIIAVNNKGRMNEMGLQVNSTAEAVTEGPSAGKEGKYYALIIGINNYRSPDITSLDNPVKDAASLYNVLSTKYSFDTANIFFLKNPTLNEIITTLDGLTGKITQNDNLLIFYAGHGYWDAKGNVGYWFPSDATKNSTVNWFRNSTLRDFIGSIQSKHTLLIADACFSGAIFKTRSGFSEAPQGVQQLYDLPSRKAMTSGVLQVVPDESTFMKYLIDRLDKNIEKFLPSELLFSNLKTAVMNNSPNVPQYGVIQNVGDEGGDFIFMKK